MPKAKKIPDHTPQTLYEAKRIIDAQKEVLKDYEEASKRQKKIAYDISVRFKKMAKDTNGKDHHSYLSAGVSSALIELGYEKEEELAHQTVYGNE